MWVGDITYIPTGEGWLYLAIVKDLCSRKIVSYVFSDRIDTQLTLSVLDMAYQRRKPLKGLIFPIVIGVCSTPQRHTESVWRNVASSRACPVGVPLTII